MTAPGLFLCGCDPLLKRSYNVQLREDGVVTGVRTDKEGHEICPEHGARMYGWASPKIQHPGGQELTDWTAVGKQSGHSTKLKLDFSSPDRRIFVDREAYGAERLARSAAGSNGAPSELR